MKPLSRFETVSAHSRPEASRPRIKPTVSPQKEKIVILSLEELLGLTLRSRPCRRHFIGDSDATALDEAALIRLWMEKRGDIESEDLPNNLLAQLGIATEAPDGDGHKRKHKRRPFKRS